MQCGHVGYYVPHRVFPNGYHCDPAIALPSYLGLASQKRYMAVSLVFASVGGPADQAWIREAFAKAGRLLDGGSAASASGP